MTKTGEAEAAHLGLGACGEGEGESAFTRKPPFPHVSEGAHTSRRAQMQSACSGWGRGREGKDSGT